MINRFGYIAQNINHIYNLSEGVISDYEVHKELFQEFKGIKIIILVGVKQFLTSYFSTIPSLHTYFFEPDSENNPEKRNILVESGNNNQKKAKGGETS